jgi:hypothetical protein
MIINLTCYSVQSLNVRPTMFQDKVKARLNQIISIEESPSAAAPAPGLLTPPPSSRKSISDHKFTLAGSLT